MRITNQIIQRNSLNNINANKILEDKLNTSISSGKKISRPSDDPIVAMRSLRLRTSVNEITQYYDKNIKDANSWMEVTEDSLESLNDILTSCINESVKASNQTLTEEDLETVFTQLKTLSDEFYEVGNNSYAGRYIFTGYRTDTPLTTRKDEEKHYTDIKESFKIADIYNSTYIKKNEVNAESDIEIDSVNKIKLYYNNIDSENINLTINGQNIPFEVIEKEENLDDSKNYFNTSTGEIILNKNLVAEINEESEINVSYNKSYFKSGDVYPEHLFDCKVNDLQFTNKKQPMEIHVGQNQSITVNTEANGVFNLGLRQIVDNLNYKLQNLKEVKSKANENSVYQKEYDALKAELNDLCKKSITQFQDIQNKVNEKVTENGSKLKRAELIEERLSSQLSTFKELKSSNEDIDIAEEIIKLQSVESAYNASLMVSSKILQQSLINFI